MNKDITNILLYIVAAVVCFAVSIWIRSSTDPNPVGTTIFLGLGWLFTIVALIAFIAKILKGLKEK